MNILKNCSFWWQNNINPANVFNNFFIVLFLTNSLGKKNITGSNLWFEYFPQLGRHGQIQMFAGLLNFVECIIQFALKKEENYI